MFVIMVQWQPAINAATVATIKPASLISGPIDLTGDARTIQRAQLTRWDRSVVKSELRP